MSEERNRIVVGQGDGQCYLAQQVPWILHWELYCNEVAKLGGPKRDVYRAEDLRGFWLIRPDGSLSYSGKYLKGLLAHAGGTLPKEMQRLA